jgi:hypothetical protein
MPVVRKLIASLLFLLMALTGCQTAPPVPKGGLILEPPADEAVASTALRHTIRHFERGDRGAFAAYVLPKTQLSRRLVENLHDVSPLVTDDMTVSMDGGVARERELGLPVKLWMVRLVDVSPRQAPRRATAEVAWMLGIGESRIYTLTLERSEGQWRVTGEKSETLIDRTAFEWVIPRALFALAPW